MAVRTTDYKEPRQKDGMLNELLAREDARAAHPRSVRRTRTGIVNGRDLVGALVTLLRALSILLIALSVLGTFYGARGIDAPILNPGRMILDMYLAPSAILLAIGVQAVLSLVQWGSRQAATDNPVWWLLYLGSLALSVWWNWAAYGDALAAAHLPWALALAIVAGGDVLPEWVLVNEG